MIGEISSDSSRIRRSLPVSVASSLAVAVGDDRVLGAVELGAALEVREVLGDRHHDPEDPGDEREHASGRRATSAKRSFFSFGRPSLRSATVLATDGAALQVLADGGAPRSAVPFLCGSHPCRRSTAQLPSSLAAPPVKGLSLALPPMPESSIQAGELALGAVDSLPEGALAAQARAEAAAPGQARHRSDRTRHPPRPRGRAREAAPVPGRRPQVVLIIGDYTARVGDPSGRSAERPVLGDEEIDANAATFTSRPSRSSTPSGPRSASTASGSRCRARELFGLVRRFTVARLLERDDFTQADGGERSRSRCSSCSTRSCRATTRSRSRPTSSSAAPIRSSTCSSAATSRSRSAARRRR